MELRIDNAEYFKECMGAVSSLIGEGNLVVTKNGIDLKAMDASNIAMIHFNLPASAFSKYELNLEEETLGINFANLDKTLSRIRTGESLVIKHKTDSMDIAFEFSNDTAKRKYKLKLIDLPKELKKTPDIAASAVIKALGSDIIAQFKDAQLLSSYIRFSLNKNEPNKAVIRANGEIGELDDDFIASITIKEDVDATFNLEFLMSMIKCCTAGMTAEISLSTDKPLVLNYHIGEAQVEYFLAPFMPE